MYPAQTTMRTPCSCSQFAIVASRCSRSSKPSSSNAPAGTPAAPARSRARTPVAVRRDRDDGELGVEQRLQVRALAADQHADHASTILPIASSPAASAAGTTAQ